MDKVTINNLHMLSNLLQQYRDLSVNGSKFFYYSYAKLDIKLQSMLKATETNYSEVEELSCINDLVVNISYDELKALTNRKRMDKRDIKNMIKDIKNNSSFTMEYDGKIKIMFIYDTILIDTEERRVTVIFNSNVIRLFESIRENPYVEINFNDILELDTKYQINLYLYLLTILRGKSGNIQISIEKLRDILARHSSVDNNNFVHRFVMKPAKEINNKENVLISTNLNRQGKNIHIKVERKN